MRPIDCPETSASNDPTPRNNPENGRIEELCDFEWCHDREHLIGRYVEGNVHGLIYGIPARR